MTFANNIDPDEAQQILGPHLRSKLVDTLWYTSKALDGNNDFCMILEEKITLRTKVKTVEFWVLF